MQARFAMGTMRFGDGETFTENDTLLALSGLAHTNNVSEAEGTGDSVTQLSEC